MRPLFDAPRVTLLVATAGVALLAIGIEIWFGSAQGKPIAKGFDRVDRVDAARRADLRPAAVADRHAGRAGRAARAVLHPHQPRPGDPRRQPGAHRDRAGRASACAGCRRFTWVLAALLGGLAALIAVPDGGSFGPGIMTSTLPHPGVHGRRARRHDEPARRVRRRRAHRHHRSRWPPAPRSSRTSPAPRARSLVFIVLLAVLVVRPQGLLGKADLMAVATRATERPAHGRRATAPFRPSPAGWAVRGVVWPAVAWLVLVFPLVAAGHRRHRVHDGGVLRRSSPCRSTCCSATSARSRSATRRSSASAPSRRRTW